jgi:hypothetical protein
LKKLLNNKLINFTFLNERIYRKIFEVYFLNIEKEKNDPGLMFKQSKLFIKCLPSLKQIAKFIKKENFQLEKNQKNIYFIKVCLDIYEDFYKTFDYPLFKKFKNIFLKVVFKFYAKLTDENMNKINEQKMYLKNLSKY